MHMKRPATPRVLPIEKVAALVRQRVDESNSATRAINIAATFATNREMSKALSEFSGAVLGRGSVDGRLREVVILRIGWNCQSVYEFGQHTLAGRAAGLTDGEIFLITRPISQGNWTPLEAALLQMTDDLYIDDCVSDATWAELSQHLDHSQIIEFMVCALMYRMASSLLNSCGVERDEGVPGWPTG